MVHIFVYAERKFIENYAYGHSRKEITDAFNDKFNLDLKQTQITAYLKNHGIKNGRDGRFKKGHTPYNKGKHIGGWEPTQFKKGNRPANIKPVGSERIDVDGYVYVKVKEPKYWKMKHVITWEQHYGQVPKGKIIIFRDGNKQHCDIENLLLIDRATSLIMNRNRLRTDVSECTDIGVNVAELIRKMNDVKKR